MYQLSQIKQNYQTDLIYIVLHNKKEKLYLLTDIAIPDDSNVNTKETEIKQVKDL
jgi:hypothetical protein